MKMIAIDDERGALDILKDAVEMAEPSASLICFHTAAVALSYVEKHQVDVAFVDVEMCSLDKLDATHFGLARGCYSKKCIYEKKPAGLPFRSPAGFYNSDFISAVIS